MVSSCVTISLVPEARGGPFVFWDDLADGCRQAQELGFDAVEIFAPSADAVNPSQLEQLLRDHQLKLAAVGTGAGWVIRRLTLSTADSQQRDEAIQFVRSIIDLGGPFGAPAIVGSMQGRFGEGTEQPDALGYLRDSLDQLAQHASQYGVPLLHEPLNRYETNLINTVQDGVDLIRSLDTDNVKLLADLFHMNIEETKLDDAIRTGGDFIGHVHFVDSNRQAAGRGHLDFVPLGEALTAINYDGYASAEAFPIPDSHEAARQTMETYRAVFL